MNRIYDSVIQEHFKSNRQMLFLSGPRQVGKTTTTREICENYLNWDNQQDRIIILKGPDSVASYLKLDKLSKQLPKVVFDELHKYRKWKQFLKGFFDKHNRNCKICVTGSSRLNVYTKSGDSLMGRYFPYRMHPFSIAKLLEQKFTENEIRSPKKLDNISFEQLYTFGGFPEPFIKASVRFYNRWKRLRTELLFREDLRDITQVKDLGSLQVLAELLENQTGQLLNYSNLARNINTSVDTVKRWIAILESVYFCFTIRPWFKNVPKSLRKQPKVYLWDWSSINEKGAKLENFIASHLLKAVNYWTDIGLGDYSLFFIRDKNKNEIDFLISKNKKPWFIAEVKHSLQKQLSKSLISFHKILSTNHAFQIVHNMDYIDADCFKTNEPVIVPLKTFLSQLV
jgi:uncharacterized protein